MKDETESYSFTMSRSLTVGGRVTQVVYPTGRTLDFERSSCACRVSGITTQAGSGSPVTIMSNVTYQPFGGASGMGMGSSATVANQFNRRGEMNATNPGTMMGRSYAYTENGQLSSIKAETISWYSRTFAYDGLGRVMNATGPFGPLQYTYDLAGNRLSETQCNSTTAYGYVTGTNRLSTVGGAAYDHDSCGRVLGAGTNAFTYNQAGQLIEVEQSGTVTGQYLYNGFGQRVRKTTTGNIYQIYDFNGNLAAEADASGTVRTEYLYNGSQRLAMASGSKVYFYHNSYQGTPELMTETNNTVVWEGSYEPFGYATVGRNSTVTNRHRFPGQYYDAESGLHYNYFRYYNPGTGRYITPDPIGLAGGINPYVYTGNDPVNGVDPYGLVRWGSVARGGFAVMGGAFGVGLGALASASGMGAIGGVPAILTGTASFSWGVSEVIIGILDNESGIPTPSLPVTTTLACTGDVDRANEIDMITSAAALGLNIGGMATRLPSNVELIGVGVEFFNQAAQSTNFKTSPKK